MEEIWKDIKGYEKKYQVSNTGKIRSLNYNNTHTIRELKPKENRYGYYEVKLSKNNKAKGFLISTLVARAFLNNNNPDKEVMHIGDVKDNSVENLKYGYRSELLHLTYKKGNRPGKPSRYKFSYNDEHYVKISELAHKHNIPVHLLHNRLERGWTLKEAVEIPKERNQKILNVTLYEYQGKLMSVKQISEKYNISTNVIYRRLSRGWSIEEAIEIPLRKKKGIMKNEKEL